jgi:hypothetical protein
MQDPSAVPPAKDSTSAEQPASDAAASPPVAPPLLAPPRNRLQLHPLSFILAIALLAVLVIWPPLTHGPDESTLAHAAAVFIGCMTFASVLGLLAWWLTGRSKLTGNVVFSVVVAVQVGGFALGGMIRSREQANRAFEQRARAVVGEIESKGGKVTSEDRRKLLATLREGSQTLSGEEAIVSAAAADLTAKLFASQNELDAKVAEAQRAGVMTLKGIDSPEELDRRVSFLRDLLKINSEVEDQLRGMGSAYARQLTDRGIDRSRIPALASKFSGSRKLKLVQEMRATDREFLQELIDDRTILRELWGHWHIDADHKGPVFDPGSEDRVSEFRNHAKAALAAAKHEQELKSSFKDVKAPASGDSGATGRQEEPKPQVAPPG